MASSMHVRNTKTTLADISKVTQVSINTVSKVLSGQAKAARISDKTIKKVQKAAKELGYIPNLIARDLRAKQTGIIGVFIADMADSNYAKIAQIVLQRLHDKGYRPLLSVAEIGLELCWQEWLLNRIQGLILCGTTDRMDNQFFHLLHQHAMTAVIAGCAYKPLQNQKKIPGLDVSSVSMDNYAGMDLAIHHLRQQNHRRIAYITGPGWHTDAYERQMAYENIIRQYHEPILAEQGTDTAFWQRGYNGMRELQHRGQSFDAVLAYDDITAIGAMKWLQENKRKIPEDVAIVGVDNAPESEYTTPALTTISLPTEAIGEKAVVLLESRLFAQSPVEKILIMPSLIPRASA